MVAIIFSPIVDKDGYMFVKDIEDYKLLLIIFFWEYPFPGLSPGRVKRNIN